MESTSTFLFVLLMMTLVAGVAIGIWQYMRVQRAKRLHTKSEFTKDTPYDR